MISNQLQSTLETALETPVPADRQSVLWPVVQYIRKKISGGEPVCLNFICTHNSRRSQLAQIWAQVAAWNYGIKASCFSGGVEVTAFNERAVDALRAQGFQIELPVEPADNPVYRVCFDHNAPPITAFSKLFDDKSNHCTAFAAVMTCSDADENCPFIPGAEKRLPVRYNDPKAFDDTPEEQEKYQERSLQIASEMLFIFRMSADQPDVEW